MICNVGQKYSLLSRVNKVVEMVMFGLVKIPLPPNRKEIRLSLRPQRASLRKMALKLRLRAFLEAFTAVKIS